MIMIHIFIETLQLDEVAEEFGVGANLQGSEVQRSKCFQMGMSCCKIKFQSEVKDHERGTSDQYQTEDM